MKTKFEDSSESYHPSLIIRKIMRIKFDRLAIIEENALLNSSGIKTPPLPVSLLP